MQLICAWCDKVLVCGYGPISHGICADCMKKELDAIKPVPKSIPSWLTQPDYSIDLGGEG